MLFYSIHNPFNSYDGLMKDTLLLSFTSKATKTLRGYLACLSKWMSQNFYPGSLVIEYMNLSPSLHIPEVPFSLDLMEQETISLTTEAAGLQNGVSI